MNLKDLKKKLDENNISTDSYSLFNDGMSECYVLTKDGYNWLVYYAERGQRVDLQSFKNESDACEYFFDLILSDLSTRKNLIDFQSMNKSWFKIKEFQSFSEFNSFVDWINDQIKLGNAEECKVTRQFYTNEKWYRHIKSGQLWRLVWPDLPFKGIFEPVDHQNKN